MNDTTRSEPRGIETPVDVDWQLIEMIERDICFLYHQLAEYSSIEGDLSYGGVFELPYWDYLDLKGLDSTRSRFIRNGCLVMLFAMALDELNGSGYLTSDQRRFLRARDVVDTLPTYGTDDDNLVSAVRNALTLVGQDRHSWDKFPEVERVSSDSSWIHHNLVRKYFSDQAAQFVTNPYYSKSVE